MLSRQEAEPRAHGRLEGVEPVAAEHPKVTFGSDAAGEVGVGCDNQDFLSWRGVLQSLR